MRRLLSALLCAGLLLVACGDDDSSGDRAAVTSIPDETPTSTTTTEPRTVAPDVIPQDVSLITEEYVEQVLNKLYEVSLESILLARAEGIVDRPSLDRIAATTSDAVFERRVNDLLNSAATGFQGLKAEPGPMRFRVVELLQADTSCIVAEVTADPSALVEGPSPREPGQREFVRLYPADASEIDTGLNPTAWVLDEFPVTFDGSQSELICEGV